MTEKLPTPEQKFAEEARRPPTRASSIPKVTAEQYQTMTERETREFNEAIARGMAIGDPAGISKALGIHKLEPSDKPRIDDCPGNARQIGKKRELAMSYVEGMTVDEFNAAFAIGASHNRITDEGITHQGSMNYQPDYHKPTIDHAKHQVDIYRAAALAIMADKVVHEFQKRSRPAYQLKKSSAEQLSQLILDALREASEL